MHNVVFLALRRLRASLILLIAVYAFGIVGMVLIPGADAEGRPVAMTVFQAFYFISYTATTIGFGEIPHAFTDTQRLWVTLVIYLSVLGWAMAVAQVLGLLQDKGFQQGLVTARFRRQVSRIGEPFYLICGFGETGMMLGKALDQLGMRFVALDANEQRIQELELIELQSDAPALAADARLPETLVSSGLSSKQCRGVVALSNDDETNLAVAIAVRLLNPRIPVLCRVQSREAAANMASFGTDYIINPFVAFGEYLALAIKSPASYRLLAWLTSLPGTHLRPRIPTPPGHWVVCGYGRFGREVVHSIRSGGFDVTVIDPAERSGGDHSAVRGLGTEKSVLQQAGLEKAVGIIAGTDDDIANLSIAVTAREINHHLFVIVRQNLQANGPLFEAFHAGMTMISSEIIANECLAIVNTPLLSRFLDVVRSRDEQWAEEVTARLTATVGESVPSFWTVEINTAGAPAIHRGLMLENLSIAVDSLTRDPANREQRLPCIPLLMVRAADTTVTPGDDIILQPGDHILFAGQRGARDAQWLTLSNINTRDYVLTGRDIPGGWVWEKIKRGRRTA